MHVFVIPNGPSFEVFYRRTSKAVGRTLLEPTEEIAAVGIPMLKEQFLNWNPNNSFLYEFEHGSAIPTDGEDYRVVFMVH